MTERPWMKSYAPDIRWDAEIPIMPIWQMLDQTAAASPGKPALDFGGKRHDYRALLELVNRAASGLQKLGVGPGVHVGLYLPNTPHFIIAFFAILKAGGTVVNYSPLDAEKVLRHKIEDSETDIIITLDQRALYPVMDKLLGTTRLKKLIIGNVGEMTATPEATQAALRASDQLSDIPRDQQRMRFADLLDNDGQCRAHVPADLHDAVAVLQYTGGTTGMPKGAMLTHANLSAACSQAQINTGGAGGLVFGAERLLVLLPLFHIYSLTFNMLLGVRIGAELVMHMRFELEHAVRDLSAKRISVFFGVPTMFTAINHFPGIDHADLSALKFCNSGGAPLPVEVHERFQQLTGLQLKEGWGMTELCGVGTMTPFVAPQKPGACGIPLCGVDLRFLSVDDSTRYVAYGERGELCAGGPHVMKGYWKNPEATAATMTADGYLRTGDVGLMDSDGFLYIVDRIKDMILCGGYNVYPRNIEEAIYKHPAVSEVIVIGVPDAYRGEAPKAYIRLKDGATQFTLDELKTFLKDSLGKHEMVQAVEFRASLPKTAVGKLSKKELYDEEKGKAAATASR